VANSGVQFKDNTVAVKAALTEAAAAFLLEAGGEVAAEAARNSRVRTGRTQRSYSYNVVDDTTVEVGSPHENAIWEEFGTGAYAEKGGGRSDAWVYQDLNGDWYRTRGKRPTRTLRNAYDSKKGAIKQRANQLFAGKLK
jgi:hypothetical protein